MLPLWAVWKYSVFWSFLIIFLVWKMWNGSNFLRVQSRIKIFVRTISEIRNHIGPQCWYFIRQNTNTLFHSKFFSRRWKNETTNWNWFPSWAHQEPRYYHVQYYTPEVMKENNRIQKFSSIEKLYWVILFTQWFKI